MQTLERGYALKKLDELIMSSLPLKQLFTNI